MRASEIQLTARINSAQKAWLAYAAMTNNRSQNAEIVCLIDAAMKADPLRVYVREADLFGELLFTVSVGLHGEDFFEATDRTAAIGCARKKIAELGLPRSAIAFNTLADKEGEAA